MKKSNENNKMNENQSKKIVYCSGPLFCPEEIESMKKISSILESKGYETFLPHRDGVENYVMGMVNSSFNINLFNVNSKVDRAIFSLDIFQLLERCDYIVMNMNGRVPDEGAIVEASMAYAAGIPLVLYKEDSRSVFKGRDNSMLSCLAITSIVHNINEIPEALEKTARKIKKAGENPYDSNKTPPMLKKNIEHGRRVWKLLQKLQRKKK